MKSIFTSEQQQYIKSNYQNTPYKEIAAILNATERQVRGWVNNHCGTKLRQFDKSYFHTIDSPEKAYWLGFIYADGWVVYSEIRRTYELGIQLKSTDWRHLEKFNQSLGGAHKIVFGSEDKYIAGYNNMSHTEYALLRIYSKQIVSDLINHGVVQNKTKALDFPRVQDYFVDFLRGYFDGDGCLYIAQRTSQSQVSFTCANRKFLEYICQVLRDQYSIIGHIYSENDRKNRIQLFGADMRRLLLLMYEDPGAVYLDRKHQKYLTLLQRPTPPEMTGVQRAKSVNA